MNSTCTAEEQLTDELKGVVVPLPLQETQAFKAMAHVGNVQPYQGIGLFTEQRARPVARCQPG
jgi:hypothetical protein